MINNNNMMMMDINVKKGLCFTLFLLLTTTVINAYRVGDTVDAAVTTRSSVAIDLMIANLPLFGITRTIKLPRLPEKFSLSFEEGLHSLPYVDGQTAERLSVTFIYSKSGTGRIHSVSSKVKRSTNRNFDPQKPVEVEFVWIEEEAVDINAGSSLMFLATLISSIGFLIQLCGVSSSGDDDDYDDDDYDAVASSKANDDYNNTMMYGKQATTTTSSSSMGYPPDARWKQRD
jgi:hypothetical protein